MSRMRKAEKPITHMTMLKKQESWAAVWFAAALHLHLKQPALEQPAMTSLMHTLRIKSRFSYTVVAVTVIYSIKSSSCPPHHKPLVNRFYLSLHLLLIPVFLTTHYSLTATASEALLLQHSFLQFKSSHRHPLLGKPDAHSIGLFLNSLHGLPNPSQQFPTLPWAGHSRALTVSHLSLHTVLESTLSRNSFAGLFPLCSCFPASVIDTISLPSLLPFPPSFP